MRSKLLLIALCATVAACKTDTPERGLATVHVPVVTSQDFVFDAAAPGGSLAPGEAERLDGWFQGLGLGYGDTLYVDGPFSDDARARVAQVAGRYGMMVQPGAPVVAGAVRPDAVRVIVSRRRAEVPGCPNWDTKAQPNFANKQMSNFGCAVSSNLAAMIADPVDLIHGREGNGVQDASTAARAIQMYRSAPPTGAKGLQSVNTKGN
ncbi:CpaD family pilus assembly protein [Sphingomonas lutea]|uniref:CpaD family pilus assembly protein n=1 Tax=Sphingomonas lutea TaxID=1045317 RepID=A0A7G9SES1_9SPHN|nr:CpaD family pilus assembly protein [Sphingomonas lutea]QNN66346.1 CpaD family pilus assembly protein [Sphingomonas lutea]